MLICQTNLCVGIGAVYGTTQLVQWLQRERIIGISITEILFRLKTQCAKSVTTSAYEDVHLRTALLGNKENVLIIYIFYSRGILHFLRLVVQLTIVNCYNDGTKRHLVLKSGNE